MKWGSHESSVWYESNHSLKKIHIGCFYANFFTLKCVLYPPLLLYILHWIVTVTSQFLETPRLVIASVRSEIQFNSVSISYTSFMLCTQLDMKCWDWLG